MPKAKATQVITHRIELQTKEREAFDMMAASYTARNVTASVGNLITPFTQCTLAGAAMAAALLAYYEIYYEETIPEKIAKARDKWNSGRDSSQWTISDEERQIEPFDGEGLRESYQNTLNRLGLLRTSIMMQLNQVIPD
jgi:hypothetical protein